MAGKAGKTWFELPKIKKPDFFPDSFRYNVTVNASPNIICDHLIGAIWPIRPVVFIDKFKWAFDQIRERQ